MHEVLVDSFVKLAQEKTVVLILNDCDIFHLSACNRLIMP